MNHSDGKAVGHSSQKKKSQQPQPSGVKDKPFDHSSDGRSFPFLSLPPEIRNMVYELVFVSPEYIGSRGNHKPNSKIFYEDVRKWRNTAFARVCRQVYTESNNIFFAKNGFEFFYLPPLLSFLGKIGPERRLLLTKISYSHKDGSPFLALRYLRSCKNLRELDISVRVLHPHNVRNSLWKFPLKNAKDFFLTDYSDIEFDDAQPSGGAFISGFGPQEQVRSIKTKASLIKALELVKKEITGLYTR
ncbi:hypothetical protein MMC20_005875 [Loxospora ochrophaea]|nr:hypothetical protein [Loxospora ochrophaea]